MLCENEIMCLVVEKSLDDKKKCHYVKYEMINNFFSTFNIWTSLLHNRDNTRAVYFQANPNHFILPGNYFRLGQGCNRF